MWVLQKLYVSFMTSKLHLILNFLQKQGQGYGVQRHFQLYCGGQFYQWRKPEYLEKITDHIFIILECKYQCDNFENKSFLCIFHLKGNYVHFKWDGNFNRFYDHSMKSVLRKNTQTFQIAIWNECCFYGKLNGIYLH